MVHTPRLAKSITESPWSTLEARIRSRDRCAIGDCGLDYTEPAHSLPGQRQLIKFSCLSDVVI